jgi:hypothetical protein
MIHIGKTFLSVTAITLAILCKLTAPAQAQVIFNPLKNLGGGVVTDPSCAGINNVAACGAVGVNGHLFINEFNDLVQSGYTDLGGIIIGKPSCTNVGTNNSQVLCGTIGTDGAVWVNRYDGFSSSFTSLSGVSISNPACTGLSAANLLSGTTKAVCTVIGTNSHLRGPQPRGNAHIQPDMRRHGEYDGFLRGSDHGRRASASTF